MFNKSLYRMTTYVRSYM